MEARFRLAGALRRLNHLGVTAVDFTGIKLSDFRFADNKIRNISNSTFYDGSWGEPFKPHKVHLRSVSFDWMRCNNVQFSPFNPLQGLVGRAAKFAQFSDCSFLHCKLKGSSFAGANLRWTNPPPPSLFDEDTDSDGNPIRIPSHYSPFEQADLEGVSFRHAHFQNADFRGALNIKMADFANATGLDSCIFDQEALENDTLRKANIKTA